MCAALSLTLYVWEWYHFLDYGERNHRLLSEILRLMRAGRGDFVQPDSGAYDERVRTEASKVCSVLIAYCYMTCISFQCGVTLCT